jgi:hypothetical protein
LLGSSKKVPEIRYGSLERVPIPVPKSKSRILPGVTSFETWLDLGGSRRSTENPLVLTRNSA